MKDQPKNFRNLWNFLLDWPWVISVMRFILSLPKCFTPCLYSHKVHKVKPISSFHSWADSENFLGENAGGEREGRGKASIWRQGSMDFLASVPSTASTAASVRPIARVRQFSFFQMFSNFFHVSNLNWLFGVLFSLSVWIWFRLIHVYILRIDSTPNFKKLPLLPSKLRYFQIIFLSLNLNLTSLQIFCLSFNIKISPWSYLKKRSHPPQ